MNNSIKNVVSSLIDLLVRKDYYAIARTTNGVRLTAEEIKDAIENYGRTLVAPPIDAFEYMDVIHIKDSQNTQWSVTMPLWTKEEGRSDLSIEITVIKKLNIFTYEFDDIHVL